MCYSIYISTTSDEDLAKIALGLFSFNHDANIESHDAQAIGLLANPNKWFLTGKYGGCSCHFRHWSSPNFPDDFGPPEDWCPEDPEDIESTGAVYDVFKRLVENREKLDVIDLWEGAESDDVRTVTVSLTAVPRESFRFLESARLIVVP